jgi:cytochrome c5
MPTFRSRMLPALAVSAALAGFAVFAAAPTVGAQDPAGTVMSACTKCHNTQRICANLGAKDKAAWNTTVTRMMGKGAQVSEAEKPAVVDWLAAQQPGAKPVCQ